MVKHFSCLNPSSKPEKSPPEQFLVDFKTVTFQYFKVTLQIPNIYLYNWDSHFYVLN